MSELTSSKLKTKLHSFTIIVETKSSSSFSTCLQRCRGTVKTLETLTPSIDTEVTVIVLSLSMKAELRQHGEKAYLTRSISLLIHILFLPDKSRFYLKIFPFCGQQREKLDEVPIIVITIVSKLVLQNSVFTDERGCLASTYFSKCWPFGICLFQTYKTSQRSNCSSRFWFKKRRSQNMTDLTKSAFIALQKVKVLGKESVPCSHHRVFRLLFMWRDKSETFVF